MLLFFSQNIHKSFEFVSWYKQPLGFKGITFIWPRLIMWITSWRSYSIFHDFYQSCPIKQTIHLGAVRWVNIWQRRCRTVAHCTFSSNLFHGQIIQIAILQLSDSENKKCSPWKVFETMHPQILQLLSRRGPRSPDAILSQHYILHWPKNDIRHFLNFCRKSFLAWK